MDYRIFDTLLEGVLIVDSAKVVVYTNEVFANRTQLSLKRLLGKSAHQMISFMPSVFPEDMKTIREATKYRHHKFSTTQGTQGEFQISMQPISDGKSDHWLLFVHDISVEEALRKKYQTELIQRERAQSELEKSRFDPLTEIYTRKVFNEYSEQLFLRHKNHRQSTDLTFLVVDVDHFKKVNDTYGHQVGDYVLQVVCSTIRDEALRPDDFVARYGGEEFVIILDTIPPQNAYVVAEKVRKKVEDKVIKVADHSFKVTISVGMAVISQDVESAKQLFDQADKALYAAKREGRNRVVIFSPESL